MDQMAELQEEAERLRAAKVQYDEELLEAVKTMSLQEPAPMPPMPVLEPAVSVSTSVRSRLVCPISLVVMKDPVTLVESGVTYDRKSICRSLLLYPALEPTTGQRYDRPLRYTPNRIVRDMVMMMYGDSYYERFDDTEFLQQYREIWSQRLVSGNSSINADPGLYYTRTELELPSNNQAVVNAEASESSNNNGLASSHVHSEGRSPDGIGAGGPSCLFALRTAKGGIPSPCCFVFDAGKKAIYGSDSNLKVWDLEHQTVLYNLDAVSPCCCVAFGNGTRAVSGMSDGTVIIWDLENRKLLNTCIHAKRSCWSTDRHSDEDRVTCCSVFANETMAISGSWDRRLKVWDLTRLRKIYSLKGHTDGVNCCSVFANDTRAISGGKDGMLIIWNLSARLQLFKLRGDAHDVTCCEVFDGDRKALSGGQDKNLKVWSLLRKKELYTLRGHTGPVRCCALLESGKRAISGSDDATLKIWDLESQAVLHTLRGHGGSVRCCAVYASETLFMSGSSDNSLRVWDLPQVAKIDA
jgi:WD40 repeat protein